MTVLMHMRYLADAALNDAQWATLTGPIAGGMPGWLSRELGLAGRPAAASAPDCLADGHTATVRAGGVLQHGPDEFGASAVNALATHLCGFTANGWHLWRRTRDDRLLDDLRTELATP
jgi:hypothetical protein